MVQKQTQRPVQGTEINDLGRVDYGDPLFPHNLTSISPVPISLFYRGELNQELDRVSVAVVGSRRASSSGLKRAHRLAAELAVAEVTVVSGLARGIDGAAHRGALAVDGRTIAVMGTGLNHVYPSEHQALFSQIIQDGAALSQFEPGFTGYHGGRNFLQRNHILVGLAQVLVVVDAEERSGSAAAIQIALGQGKPVGLLRSLVDSQGWAAQLVESGRAFVVAGTEDVMRRLDQ